MILAPAVLRPFHIPEVPANRIVAVLAVWFGLYKASHGMRRFLYPRLQGGDLPGQLLDDLGIVRGGAGEHRSVSGVVVRDN